jgi:hypothetical protein
MLEQLRKNIGISFAGLQGRRRRGKQVNFRGAYTKARSALFILPPEEEHRGMVLSVLQKAQNQFKGNAMTVLSSSSASRAISGKLHQCMMVPVHDEQVNFFFLPKKDLLLRLQEKQYDVIVDLNLNVTPLAASVCAHLDAPLKAGFSSPLSARVYNFEVKSAESRHPKHLYERLVQTLAMF